MAPVVTGEGGCNVDQVGDGYIRADQLDPSQLLGITFSPASSLYTGAIMMVFPPVIPEINILEVAEQTIPEGASSAYNFMLPYGASSNQTILIQAKDFSDTNAPVRVALSPNKGAPSFFDVDIDMTGGNVATSTVNVVVPLNIITHVHAWTR